MSLLGFANTADALSWSGTFVFLTVAFVVACVMLALSFIRGVRNPDPEKNSAYECGFDLIGDIDQPLPMRFHVIAILFIVFDVELMLLLPWSVSVPLLGWPALISVLCFLALLGLGLACEWRAGALEWE